MKFSCNNLDLAIIETIKPQSNSFLNVIAGCIANITFAGICWWLLAIFMWFRGEKLFARRMSVCLLIALIVCELSKHVIHRVRPLVAISSLHYLHYQNLLDDKESFPSGHTLLAAAGAFVILFHYKDWRGGLAIVFSLIVGLTRIYQGMHYPSDVISGFVLGFLSAVTANLSISASEDRFGKSHKHRI